MQERTRKSVEHRRKPGGNLNGRPKTSDKKERLVLRLRSAWASYRLICDKTGVCISKNQRILQSQETSQPEERRLGLAPH